MKLIDKLKEVERAVESQEKAESNARKQRLKSFLNSQVFLYTMKRRSSSGLNYVLIDFIFMDANVKPVNSTEEFDLVNLIVEVTGFKKGEDVDKLYFS